MPSLLSFFIMPPSQALPLPDWPQVPACYDWLSLDRRGGWRLRGEPVVHAGLAEFISRNYGCDAAGNWYVQNGPQRVFVSLEYTPLVLRLEPDGSMRTHTGAPAGAADAVYLDDEGNVLLHALAGIGLLDDRDLAVFVDGCRVDGGSAADEAALLGVMEDAADVLWRGLLLRGIRRQDVPTHFGFQPRPAP